MEENESITFQEFLDFEGNLYQVKGILEGNAAKVMFLDVCNHTFVNGYYKSHTKKTDGGCVVVTYKAQICTICGFVLKGALYSTTTYAVCPH